MNREMMNRSTYPIERRSQTIAGKLLRAQRMIEAEIRSNRGAYPHNEGRLTEAEVCRRAGVAATTLQSSAHASTTRVQLGRWLAKIAVSMTPPRKDGEGDGAAEELKSDVGSRADEWKALLENIAASYDNANVEVARLRTRVKAMKEREDALAAKHANFNATLPRKRCEPSR